MDKTKLRAVLTCDTSCIIPDTQYKQVLQGFSGKTDRERAEAVFLWLSRHCTYDTGHGAHANDDSGVWAAGKACCQGVSFAFKRFCDLEGTPCVLATSCTSMDTYHMAPLIQLSDSWYLCDVTGALDTWKPFSFFCMDEDGVKQVLRQPVFFPQK